ncbi:hypothetical protein GCM10009630_70820 [Kribbella jejuensis]|uniref:Uncharacterized protein n=1 Tax=Kribbella jejuensis TaxID=236068 RepID=A0A542DU17_9ACTN|nr:hypothetical protein [Kribbella jejuensis]TQJ06601.1 hypothetical protein FB475_6266 [Kribbella jejuensis]
MNKFFLIVHILAAILCVGPITVAASMYPPLAKKMLAAQTPDAGGLQVLHRITTVYAWASLVVPLFGFALAGSMHVMGEAWLIISIVLTLAAALVLAYLVVPAQSAVLAVAGGTPEERSAVLPKAKLLSMTSGIFALLWLIVLVLMVVKPGHHRG